MNEKYYKDIAGWQKHMRRTAQDQNLSKSTRRKINYRIGLLDRLVNEVKNRDQSRKLKVV